MLNRRLLRVKVLQNVYAFEQCRESNFNLAIDKIKELFEPDLNSKEVQDKKQLAEDRQKAIEIFKENFKKSETSAEATPKVLGTVKIAVNFYKQQVQKDYEFLRRQMVDQTEQIFDRYLKILLLLTELADYVKEDYLQKRKKQYVTSLVFDEEQKLFHNSLIDKLRKHTVLQEEIQKRRLRWDIGLISQWYKLLVKEPFYVAYQKDELKDAEKEFEVVDAMFKQFILKNEVIESFFDEEDIHWEENQAVLKSMVAKTLRDLHQNEDDQEETKLYVLSQNWQDDKEFFRELFRFTIINEDEYEQLVSEKIKNWSLDRLTYVDKIALKMAICEMVNFPSIPVKASINEYLEVVKIYGTPRSKDFVNGVLDVLSKELTENGKIRKSGRGLIDSK